MDKLYFIPDWGTYVKTLKDIPETTAYLEAYRGDNDFMIIEHWKTGDGQRADIAFDKDEYDTSAYYQVLNQFEKMHSVRLFQPISMTIPKRMFDKYMKRK